MVTVDQILIAGWVPKPKPTTRHGSAKSTNLSSKFILIFQFSKGLTIAFQVPIWIFT